MKIKLIKLITILILSIIAINCKKSTEPLTLSDRAGTYTFENKGWTIYHYVVVNKDGTGTLILSPEQSFNITIGNPSSTDTVFTLDFKNGIPSNYIIDFKNGTLTEPNPPPFTVWTLVR
ncbi:hypothetical protein [uncultured Brachyspira sp.]|uniref:hypothetical protein n=1 Tax=uncultured Brachyspira sp. TaxID=221953 RepID=UPI002598A44E|nr:hypothetical protein [uncultured Brachyspira sp.]